MVEAKLMRIYSSNCLMGKAGLKELKSCIGTDTQLQTDAAQPSDLDFQQMSQGSSRPILKCIYINISLLPLLSNHYSSLRNIKKLQCSVPYASIYIKKKTKKCTSTPLLLSPNPTTVDYFL